MDWLGRFSLAKDNAEILRCAQDDGGLYCGAKADAEMLRFAQDDGVLCCGAKTKAGMLRFAQDDGVVCCGTKEKAGILCFAQDGGVVCCGSEGKAGILRFAQDDGVVCCGTKDKVGMLCCARDDGVLSIAAHSVSFAGNHRFIFNLLTFLHPRQRRFAYMQVQGIGTAEKKPLKTGWAQSGRMPSQDFRELVVTHQSRVYSIAYRILQDRWTAEEVAQDVFLALSRNLERIESDEHLLAWLRRVAVQRAMDACRYRASRPDIAGEEYREDRLETAVGTLEASLVSPSSSSYMAQLVASLPAIQRTAIVLRYQEDMLPREIAELLKMPLATVKSHLQRALKLLRSKAERQGKEFAHG
jgi:RNA polymerase sigma-70 factor (ECF subfamily)